MLDMFAFTLPVFFVIGLGVLAARLGLLGNDAVRPLNLFVFYFAMPALIAGALARQDISEILTPELLIAWLLAGIAVFVAGAAIAFLMGERSLGAMAIMGQGSAVGNIGFLALPLAFSVFGDAAAGPVAITLIVDLVIIIPLSIALLEFARGAEDGEATVGSAGRTLQRVLVGVMLNPFILSIVLGLALSASGVGLPGPLARFSDFLGAAAGPAALFALGVSLSGRRVAGQTTAIASMTVLKLVIHPVLVFAILFLLFDTDPAVAGILVLIAAMPIAGNVFVIASQYGVLVRRSSSAVLVSTALSVLTVSIVLSLVTGAMRLG